ncbi:hypothetical protein SELMODRAFT_449457 [Selaginella moellendorffii]|uniref:Uncharacterized protein ISCP-1 n=1 Tax=Selaginella moellendorffii TaxID=88036 RepID=D8RWN1_SELML|nr:uncharacterized protein LOC9630613 [Selaginella moellendorffii]EFJ23287.1 hypothetical protein SELMODRAFT_449457 [Selaginella moellendorffii]|eukprot:XP_002975658.1 uncharacterized protein LOC9630613 [Selaginella moellendorffii]
MASAAIGLNPLPNLSRTPPLSCGGAGRFCASRAALWQQIDGKCGGLRAGFLKCSSSSEITTATTPDSSEEEEAGGAGSWIPVVPFATLPRGERRLVRQENETILLLWYKNDVYAVENKSPAEGAYSEGLINAKLTPDGCIVCPSTSSTFSLQTGEIKDWYPTNPVMKLLLQPTRNLVTYPVKIDGDYIYINTQQQAEDKKSTEIVFSGPTFAGRTASDVNIEEVRMVVEDENKRVFGFTPENEITNGRAAMMGFSLLLVFELVTGKGFLRGTGFLDFLYQFFK